MFASNVTKNSLTTDNFKSHRQTDKNVSRHVTLRQDIESYPIIIAACVHIKDDNKQSEDT
jgi:hypothetical protein